MLRELKPESNEEEINDVLPQRILLWLTYERKGRKGKINIAGLRINS